ncbi:MAG: hypothetical protein L0211_04360 [Planctomycetaceae bacterium]|nr:hypothetical protein [Planctomycetaceae bacterium]
MLVILSDLHLNDGTCGSILAPGTMNLLSERLCDLAWRASWRADGAYQPIERLDLVLLGDVLDITCSQRWLKGDARPWSDITSHAVSDTVAAIVDEILRRNVECIRTLRSLATEATISLPPATASGQPVLDAEEMPVAVYTHYMVGNHDWLLHLRGPSYDVIRHKVAHHLGLVSPHNKPFAHEASECDELHEALRRHRVLARHGDIFDPLSFADDRDAASLSDAISIELVGNFLGHIEDQIAAELPAAAARALADIDQIRPNLLIPAWMEGMLERTGCTLAQRSAIKRIWDYMAEQLLHLEIVRKCAAASSADMLDGLAAALKFGRRDSADWAGRTINWLNNLRGAATTSYAMHALAEADFRNRRARHIVYGHTHSYEILPLDASHADGYVLNQTYFNAGTWRRVYRPTQAISGCHEFIAADCFTLLAFYQADERSGRSHETWSGTLAPSTIETAQRSQGATAGSPSSASSPIRAPQFASSRGMATSRGY